MNCILFKDSAYLSFMTVGWKVHKLTKILWWNVTKRDLFRNIVPPLMLQCFDSKLSSTTYLTTSSLQYFLSVNRRLGQIKTTGRVIKQWKPTITHRNHWNWKLPYWSILHREKKTFFLSFISFDRPSYLLQQVRIVLSIDKVTLL